MISVHIGNPRLEKSVVASVSEPSYLIEEVGNGEAVNNRQSGSCCKSPLCLPSIFWFGVLAEVSEQERVCDKVLGAPRILAIAHNNHLS